jgi:hypothetical protein
MMMQALEAIVYADWLTFNDWLAYRGAGIAFSKHEQSILVETKFGMQKHHLIACQLARRLLADGGWNAHDPKCCLLSCRRLTGLWLPRIGPGHGREEEQRKLDMLSPMSEPQKPVTRYMQENKTGIWWLRKRWLVLCSERCGRDAQAIVRILSAKSRLPCDAYGTIVGVDREEVTGRVLRPQARLQWEMWEMARGR